MPDTPKSDTPKSDPPEPDTLEPDTPEPDALKPDKGLPELLAAERSLIAMRHGGAPWPENRIVGLALSGGGIRSATFCLGFLQTLSARGLIPFVDYMSTVSGGSYAGSFFGSLFVSDEWRGDGRPGKDRLKFEPDRPLQCDLGREAIRRVRDMGRYLTPAGTSDAFYGGAIVSRNWVAVQFVIGMAALLLFWVMHGVDHAIWGHDPRANLLVKPMTPTLERVSLALLGFTLACGNAYWLTRRDTIPVNRALRVLLNMVFWAFLAVFVFSTSPWWSTAAFGAWTPRPSYLTSFIAYVSGSAILLIVIAEWCRGRLKTEQPDKQNLIAAEDAVRSLLSRCMAQALTLTLTFAALGCIDYLGHAAFRSVSTLSLGNLTWTGLAANAWPALVTLFPPLASYLASRGLKNRRAQDEEAPAARRNWAPAMVMLVGLATIAIWLVLWSAVATATGEWLEDLPLYWGVICAVLVLINLGASVSFSFINLSSLSTFYAARLRRAYIGASSYGNAGTSVSKDDPQDTIRIHDYYHAGIRNGAPLHLINVTIAETVADNSNLVARDRKGKPMHLSPAGLVYEGDKPGEAVARLRETGSEELPLANWIAISGAAVSAAIGSGTSLGTSILATMANVRLGYWWRGKPVKQWSWKWFRNWRGAFWADWTDTVQNYLFLELRGKFTGTARNRWYLTDGGHFENTGVYPLLQREVPFIIACDNGADPRYRMEDVMRLMGRARTDLGVKLTFLGDDALTEQLGTESPIRGAVGTLQALQARGSPASPGGPVAALARIDYGDGKPKGWLLLVKPRLAYTEPPEVLAYHSRAGEFPQQTTGDQFFDEEQWEAYRRLGEVTGERLFPEGAPATANGWLPEDAMRPRPAPPPPPAPPPLPTSPRPADRPGEGLRGRLGRWLACAR